MTGPEAQGSEPFEIPTTLVASRVFPLVLALFLLPMAPLFIWRAFVEPGFTLISSALFATLGPVFLLWQVFRPARLELSQECLVLRTSLRDFTLRWEWVEEFSVVQYRVGHTIVRQLAVRLNADGQDRVDLSSFTILSNRAYGDFDFTFPALRFGKISRAELADRLNSTLGKIRSV